MVRVKARYDMIEGLLAVFQFQYGASEGVYDMLNRIAVSGFQFQYGASEG